MKRRGGICLAVVALVLCACTPPPSKPLKIIVSVPQEADFGKQMGNATQMAFDETGGKIGDIPIEMTIFDGGLDDNKELAVIDSIKDDPQVVAYIGGYRSSFAKDVIPLTNQLQIPMVSSSATWPGLTKIGYGPGEPGIYYPSGQRTFFRTVPGDDLQGKVAIQFMQDQGYKSVYIVSGSDDYSLGLANLMLANAEDARLTITGRSQFDEIKATDDEIQAIVTAIDAANPDVIYFPAATGDRTLVVFSAIHNNSPDRPMIGSDFLIGSGLANNTEFDNVYATVFQIQPDQTPRLTAFAKKFEETYKVAPNEYTINSYEAATMLFDAISRAGSAPTRESVLKALRETRDYNGVLGTWSFDDNGDTSYASFALLALQNGAWTPLTDAGR